MALRRLALTLTAVVATAGVLAPLPAHADSRTTRDAAHDIRSQSIDGDVPRHPEPARTEGDARSLRVVHGKRFVRLALRSGKLTRSAKLQAVHSFTLRTNEGRRVELVLWVHDKQWQGDRTLTVDDHDRTCRGLRTYIDYRRETVRAVIPRRCLSDPRWVRVGGGSGFLAGSKLFVDDVNRDGKVTDEPKLGRRVRR